jgi:hypothetical protein
MADNKSPKEDDVSDDDLDQIIQDMSKEEEEVKTTSAPALSVVGKKTSAPMERPDQALSLELTGVVNLKLCFSSGERSIEVLCTEEALVCRMADGTEFRIPTGITKSKAA